MMDAPAPPPQTPPPAAPISELSDLGEELDDVLKMLPERPQRSDAALADELAMLLAGLPAVAPEPAAKAAPAEPPVSAPMMPDEPPEVVSTQPLLRVSRHEAALPAEPVAQAAKGPTHHRAPCPKRRRRPRRKPCRKCWSLSPRQPRRR